MTRVQLDTLGDSNSEESFGASSALVLSAIMTVIVGTLVLSGSVSMLLGTATAAKTSTSLGSFVKNTLLNTVLAMSVILSLMGNYLHLLSEPPDATPSSTNATFLVIFVLLAIVYKFALPFDMGTRSKILVLLIIFHVIYWGGRWMYDISNDQEDIESSS